MTTIQDVMSKQFVAVSPEITLAEAVEILTQHRISCVRWFLRMGS